MQIASILYPVLSLGINKRVGVWTSGCLKHCPGCISPEYQFFNSDLEMNPKDVGKIIKKHHPDGVTISGGEPFLWIKGLRELVEYIYKNVTDDILIFTGFTYEELKNKNDGDIDYILSHISVLVDGPFIESQYVDNRLKGSDNQRILILNKKYLDAYQEYINQEKTVDIFEGEGKTHLIGVPSKDRKENIRKVMEEKL